MNKTPEQILEYKVNLFGDTIRGKNPERIPHMCNFWTWKSWASGYKLSDVLYTPEHMVPAMRKFFETYDFDSYADTGARNPLNVAKAVGADDIYIINDETNGVSVKEQSLLGDDEYDLILNSKNYMMFQWTVAIPRKAKALQQMPNFETLKEGLIEYNKFFQAQGEIGKIMKNEFGVPSKRAYTMPVAGIEPIFNTFRGIKNLSVDLRRQYDKVCAAADWITNQTKGNYEKSNAGKCEGQTPGFAFDIYYSMLAHTILNPKQFERLIWPKYVELSQLSTEHDKTVCIYCEGSSKHLRDFFRDLPDNRFTFALEQDDIFEFKKDLPNCIPQGGISRNVLADSTPDQVVDYAKMLIDKLAYDKKYIFATDKMMTFANDCKPENLDALCKFVTEFRY